MIEDAFLWSPSVLGTDDQFLQPFIAGCVFIGLSSFIKVAHGKKFLLCPFRILANKKQALTGIIFVTKLFYPLLNFLYSTKYPKKLLWIMLFI